MRRDCGAKLGIIGNNNPEGCRLEWTDTHDQKLYRDQPWDTLTEAVLFIEDARKRGGNVVVHCAQGKSRSTTVVVGK
jgi:protein-tyrosine phosphatase